MANILDVARLAGVSPMTVSRALNRPDMVRPDTRARVLSAAEQLGYVPNAAARSLVQGRTGLVALVLSDIRNPFFTNVARGVEDVAQKHGYTLVLGNTDERPEKARQYLEALSSRRVDGVILSAAGADEVRLLRRRGISVVLFDRVGPGLEADSAVTDVYDGGRRLVAHLLERGYREIAFVGGQAGNPTLERRLAGCRDALREAGLSPRVHLGRFDRASGEEITAALCAQERLPDAVIAANNLVAVGALVELRRRGLRVPDDLGLACFGEIELAALIDPFLTVLRDPEYEIGCRVMEMLHERISGYGGPPRQEVFPEELVVRRSTRSPGRRRET